MTQRKTIRPSVRFEVFKRDAFTCQYCGRTPPTVVLEVDHVIAVVGGGTNDLENLMSACRDCNAGKGARPLDAIPAGGLERLDARREAAEQVRQYNAFLLDQRDLETATTERVGAYWYRRISRRSNLLFGAAREGSIRVFLGRLPEAEILDAIDRAMSRIPPGSKDRDEPTWRYFCGICWTKIRERNVGA